MGAGASSGIGAAIGLASEDDLKTACQNLSEEQRQKCLAGLGVETAAGGDAAGGEVDWAAMFAPPSVPHADQKAQGAFGPDPDYSKPESWYWFGDDGTVGPELVPDGVDKPSVADRAADCFYIHPTSFYCGGDIWNMPLSGDQFTGWQGTTEFYLATEASVFNGSCRIYAPKFRQCVLGCMPCSNDDGHAAADFAYADVKAAFEHYLKDRNDGRPLVLASHSQGSLFLIRLLQDFVESKPLFKQVVAIYCLAAWAPLSMFEGDKAVFKEIQIAKAANSTGCFISYTCEHPTTVAAHQEATAAGSEDWFPRVGHRCGDEWRVCTGEPYVCTNPLTWSSNGLGGLSEPEAYLGMLNLFMKNVTSDQGPIEDCDTFNMAMMTPNSGLKVHSLAKLDATELLSKLEEPGAFKINVDEKTGDLQVVPLPTNIAGSEIGSYEHMNYILFYFNLRDNVRTRLSAHAGV